MISAEAESRGGCRKGVLGEDSGEQGNSQVCVGGLRGAGTSWQSSGGCEKEKLRLGRAQGWIESGLGHIISLSNAFLIFLIIISAGFERKNRSWFLWPPPQTTTSCNKKKPFQISKPAKLPLFLLPGSLSSTCTLSWVTFSLPGYYRKCMLLTFVRTPWTCQHKKKQFAREGTFQFFPAHSLLTLS